MSYLPSSPQKFTL